MEKIKSLYQKVLHSPKLLFVTGLTLFSLILIIFTASSFRKGGKSLLPLSPTPTPTPIIGHITQEEPFPTPSLSIVWSNQEIDIPDSLDIYAISQPLVSPRNAQSYSQKLGFTDQDEQESIDDNFRAWIKGDISLTVNLLENTVAFSSGIIPTSQNQDYTEDSYLLAAHNYLQNIFGAEFSQSLIKQSLTYHKMQGLETIPASPGDSTLVRISFYQTIDGYPLANISETGSIVSLFLDKKLGLISFSVREAYSSLNSIGQFHTVPLSQLVDNADALALRINASPYYDIAVDTVSAKNINFNQSTVQLAYLSYKKQLIPVYLLEGTVKTRVTEDQPGLYIIPATRQL